MNKRSIIIVAILVVGIAIIGGVHAMNQQRNNSTQSQGASQGESTQQADNLYRYENDTITIPLSLAGYDLLTNDTIEKMRENSERGNACGYLMVHETDADFDGWGGGATYVKNINDVASKTCEAAEDERKLSDDYIVFDIHRVKNPEKIEDITIAGSNNEQHSFPVPGVKCAMTLDGDDYNRQECLVMRENYLLKVESYGSSEDVPKLAEFLNTIKSASTAQ